MRTRLLFSTAMAVALSVPPLAMAQQTTTQQDAATQQASPAPLPAQPAQPAAQGAPANTAPQGGQQETQPNVTVVTPEGEPQEQAEGGEANVTIVPADEAETEEAEAATGSGIEISADDMIGRDVMGSDGERIGEIDDVIVDPETKEIRRLVIGSGGFLGIGKKQVALDIDQVEIRPEEGIFAREITQADIEGLPEYDPDEETATLDQPPPAAPVAPGASPTGAMAPGMSTVPPPDTTGPTTGQ